MNIEVPDFGELLGGHIAKIPERSHPAFLARLERTAADRYRHWAAELPEHAELLLACAEREDEIADRVEAVLPAADAADQQMIDEEIEAARSTYYNAFSAYGVWEQLYLQSRAERQGAAAWRNYAALDQYRELIDALEACALTEEVSADALDKLLAEQPVQ